SGERLLGYARRILTLQQEAETMLGDSAGTASIRIGVPDDIVTGNMAQVFAGYLDAMSGERLAYVVYVNNVSPIESIAQVIGVFADEGVISALLRARY
ncbi:MAG: hypothetical protein J0H08_15755, partial [Rhizobiales bacterium]|nr:hypothetical protein [Hyphomicrobiales bacterium]